MSVATVSAKGWVVIPKAFRQQFDLKPGSRVRFVAYRGGLYLFPVSDDPIAAIHGMFAGGPSMIDDLLAEHQRELAREEEELGEALRSG
jgi:AbrB family looped-hinge helix DNA binding protein